MRRLYRRSGMLWSITVLALGLHFGPGGEAAASVSTSPDDPWIQAIRYAVAADASLEDLENLPSSERRERLRRWRSLPPEQRRVLRERLKRLKRMDEADRQLYERRFRQWKQLDPAERRRLLRKFDRWESLSPQEREAIRRRFREP